MEAKSTILKKDELLSLVHPATFSGFQPLKEETNNRQILKGCLKNSSESLVIKIFKRPSFFDQVKYLVRPPRSRKEWRIGQKLSYLNIPIPPLVGYVALRRRWFLVQDLIVFRELTRVEPLIDWVEKNVIQKSLSGIERHRVIQALGRFVRRIHDEGIFSNDFHQGNILIHAEQGKPPLLYVSDLHAIQIKNLLTVRERVKTLAQFNSFRIPITDRLRFLEAYLQGKGKEKTAKKILAKSITSASFKNWRRVWQKRKKRSLRAGKGLQAFDAGAWKGMIRKGYDVKNIIDLIDTPRESMSGGSGTTDLLLQENVKNLVVRCYEQPAHFPELKSLFNLSRARKNWIALHNLIARGIPTVVPVAFGERKRWGSVRDCFLVFEKMPDAVPGHIFFKGLFAASPSGGEPSLKKSFISRLAQVIRWMHQTGVCFRSLQLSGFGVTVDREKVLLHVLDQDSVVIRKNLRMRDVVCDLKNVCRSFLHENDQNLFFKRYAWGNSFFKDNEKKIRDTLKMFSTKPDE